MKTRNLIISVVLFFVLNQCKEDDLVGYTNLDIVVDNSQAALYFHTIFREAENAWAIVHSKGYEDFTEVFEQQHTYKKMTYDEEENEVTIEYHEWLSHNLNLGGTIHLNLSNKDSFRKQREFIGVLLSDFSIEGQIITGSASLQYNTPAREDDDEEEEEDYEEPNDRYIFNLSDGIIREQGVRMPTLITAAITGGNYERTAGSETLSPDDDEWRYDGTMTGMLREMPGMNYRNVVVPAIVIDGQNVEAAIYYDMICKTALRGYSVITVQGRVIEFVYLCDAIEFYNETRNYRD